MTIRILYFAVLRERLRCPAETMEIPDGCTAGDALDRLARRHPEIGNFKDALRVAVNEEFVPASHPLQDGDELALIPPVAGGAAYCRLSTEPLSLPEVIDAVRDVNLGGIVTFCGVVRGQSRGKRVIRLEYEAYQSMAQRTMASLIDTIEKNRSARVGIVHRVGILSVGEAAVVIAAGACHRAEAFAACQEAIDRLKEEVPIWKKEVYDDGETWIGFRP